MIDYTFITPRLATGGAALKAVGITHVIDCRDDAPDDVKDMEATGLDAILNGTPDDGQPKPVSWFQVSLTFAWSALVDPRAKVYAHCAAGINRGPSTAYAILRSMGFTSVAAKYLLVTKRPQCAVGIQYANDADKAILALGYEP